MAEDGGTESGTFCVKAANSMHMHTYSTHVCTDIQGSKHLRLIRYKIYKMKLSYLDIHFLKKDTGLTGEDSDMNPVCVCISFA